MVHTELITVSTKGFGDTLDITAAVATAVSRSKVQTGIACVAIPGSTAAITTIEFEPGAVADLKAALERLAPANGDYQHNATWGDGNGYAHLRSALIGASRSLPVRFGQLALGTWQQLVLLDFDNRPRQRQLIVTIVGE